MPEETQTVLVGGEVVKSDIKMFGCEIECGTYGRETQSYEELCDEVRGIGWELGSDGSVHTGFNDVEIRTKPYEDIKALMTDYAKTARFLKGVNDTCGFHVHVSLKSHVAARRLCSYDFYRFFEKEYKKEFTRSIDLDRLENTYSRRYCSQKDFDARLAEQCIGVRNGRYNAVNFNSWFLPMNTIEFRVFAGTIDAERISKVLCFLKRVIDSWLSNPDNGKSTEKDSVEVVIPVVEEFVEVKLPVEHDDIFSMKSRWD